jgi:hypothetical protein
MTKIADPASYFENLGGLHDARVEGFIWLKDNSRITICVDDVNSNSLNLPGHVALAGKVVFEEIHSLDAELHIDDSSLSIYDLVAETKGGKLYVSISFSPFGKMSFVCANVVVHEEAS